MDYYISVALIGIIAVFAAVISLPTLKILQLSGYRSRGVFGYWKTTKCADLVRYAALTILGGIAVAIFVGCFGAYEYARYCATALIVLLEIIFVAVIKKNGDTNIKATPRMIRLIILNSLILLGLAALAAWAAYYHPFCQVVAAALGIFVPFTVMAANTLLLPLERANNNKYIRKAKAKLQESKPVVIGITGSFGKTTAKSILLAMLDKKFTVCATPGNYNTPMGICKTLNDAYAGEKIFIAELGARYKGDVKELCDIVKPHYGIITAVGDMHIATLGSREGVADVKFELAQNTDSDGTVFLNGYNADCAKLYERTGSCTLERMGDGERVYYKDLTYGAFGARFTLCVGDRSVPITTKLLGRHIPELVCVCAAVADALGVELSDIAAAVEGMPPVEHRLQLMEGNGSVTVIDDAYNSNPVGAANAIDVLSSFGGTKIIITPGFVELGVIEKQCNIELGKKIGACCDYAYLVGSRAEDIKSGAVQSGMDESKIKVFVCRDDAVKALSEIPDAGERTVLFENDLPDNIK